MCSFLHKTLILHPRVHAGRRKGCASPQQSVTQLKVYLRREELARHSLKIKMMLSSEPSRVCFPSRSSSGVNKKVMCTPDWGTGENNTAAIILSSVTHLPTAHKWKISFGSCSNPTAAVQLKCCVSGGFRQKYLVASCI